MSFIDTHREELGIEPICRELAIAPSSYHEHAARRADPGRRPARARCDDELKQEIRRVHENSFGLYGSRKVWHQLRREGIAVAKCTVERLMRAMGLAGVRRGKTTVTTVSDPKAPCPLDKVNRAFRVSRPNALWVVDFTYAHTWVGFVYGGFNRPSQHPVSVGVHDDRKTKIRTLDSAQIGLARTATCLAA